MSSALPASSPEPELNRRWVRAVRVAHVAAVVLYAPFLLGTVQLMGPFVVIAAVPLVFFWVRILRAPAQDRKKDWLALVLGVGVGTFLVMALSSTVAILGEARMVFLIYLMPIALLQVFLIVAAIKMYSALTREPADRNKLARGLFWGGVYSLALLLPIAVTLPGLLRSRIAANEASAVGALRTLNTAESTYTATYKRGFTDGLNRLGPSRGSRLDENRADLVDEVLGGLTAGGTNTSFARSGYIFTYTPGTPGPDARIITYTIVARPVKRGGTGWRSFFTDESGIVRSTSEDRPATVQDPPL